MIGLSEIHVENWGDMHLLSSEFLTVVQQAAVAVYPWIGKGNKNEADGRQQK